MFAMQSNLDARSRDKLKKFSKLGRLFDAQRLLEERGTTRLRKTRKWTPLFMAVDRGFHSFVETLLRFEHAQWDLEKSYAGALRRRRNDLAGMILRSSWWTGKIDPVEALATGDTELVCTLVKSGIDFTKEPVVKQAALRNAKGTLDCLHAAKISIDAVEGQLYSALIFHAEQGHLKSVVHLLKAGLDPHTQVVWYEGRGSADDKTSAVHAALFSNKPALLAMLKPSPEKDNAEDLMGSVMLRENRRMFDVLFAAGFPVNCQANGGSPTLHDVLMSAGLFSYQA